MHIASSPWRVSSTELWGSNGAATAASVVEEAPEHTKEGAPSARKSTSAKQRRAAQQRSSEFKGPGNENVIGVAALASLLNIDRIKKAQETAAKLKASDKSSGEGFQQAGTAHTALHNFHQQRSKRHNPLRVWLQKARLPIQ